MTKWWWLMACCVIRRVDAWEVEMHDPNNVGGNNDAALATLVWFNLTVVPEFSPSLFEYRATVGVLLNKNHSTYISSVETRGGATLAPSCVIGPAGRLDIPYGISQRHVVGVAHNGNTLTYTLTITRLCPFGYYCVDFHAFMLCPMPPAASMVCNNGGACVVTIDTTTESRCMCAAGFTGSLCQTNVNECLSNPCQHNAICIDKINGFRCECPSGFNGTFCHVAVDVNSKNQRPDNFDQEHIPSTHYFATVAAISIGAIVLIFAAFCVAYHSRCCRTKQFKPTFSVDQV
jgi:hypothetical protein